MSPALAGGRSPLWWRARTCPASVCAQDRPRAAGEEMRADERRGPLWSSVGVEVVWAARRWVSVLVRPRGGRPRPGRARGWPAAGGRRRGFGPRPRPVRGGRAPCGPGPGGAAAPRTGPGRTPAGPWRWPCAPRRTGRRWWWRRSGTRGGRGRGSPRTSAAGSGPGPASTGSCAHGGAGGPGAARSIHKPQPPIHRPGRVLAARPLPWYVSPGRTAGTAGPGRTGAAARPCPAPGSTTCPRRR